MRWAVIGVLLGGCNLILGIEGASPLPADAGVDAVVADAGSPVSVVAIHQHHTEAGMTPVAAEARTKAYVPNGTGFDEVTAPAGPEQRLAVPAGDYWLAMVVNPPAYVWTAARSIDVGRSFMGRAAPVAQAGAQVRMTGNQFMTGWLASHRPAIASTELGIFYPLEPTSSMIISGYPAVAAMTVDLTLDWAGKPLADGAQSDELRILVYSIGGAAVLQNGIIYVAQVGTSPAIAATGLSDLPDGTFTAPATTTTTVDWRISQFAAHAQLAHTPVVDLLWEFALYAQPAGASGRYPDQWSAPRLAWREHDVAEDQNLGEGSFRQPFSGMIVVRQAETRFAVDYDLGPYTRRQPARNITVVDLDGAPAITQPLIGPVSMPTVNGASAFTDATGVGEHPQIAWKAPILGTVNRYVIRVFTYLGDQSAVPVVDLIVPGRTTSVRVPPGVLRADAWHTFEIQAIMAGGDPETAPNRSTLPFARTSILSGKFAVAGVPF